MLSNISHNSINKPDFAPSIKVDNLYEEILIENIPQFINDLQNQSFTKPLSETDYTQELISTITRSLINSPRGVAILADYKDIYTIGANVRKKVDFSFISSVNGASKKSLYSVEAKRLPTGFGEREKEYVTGYYANNQEPNGGILRFKTGDHGYGLNKCAIVGYIEDKNFDYWYITINNWIKAEANNSSGLWHNREQLKQLIKDSDGNLSICRSITKRNIEQDDLNLFHLWIKIPEK